MDKFATRGRAIGEGSTRRAFVSKHWPDRVVKVALYEQGQDENQIEFELWREAHWRLRKHLARVYDVSDDGQYLLMQRTRPISVRQHRRLLIPAVLDHDSHAGNFGRLPDKRIVMHDYAWAAGARTTGGSYVHPSFV